MYFVFPCLVFVYEKRFYFYFREFYHKNNMAGMEDDTKPPVEDICRTCLSKTSDLRSLDNIIEGDNRTLQDALVFVCNLDIKASDKLPRFVCSDCEVIMCKADAFKRRCHESESFLYLQYGIDQNPSFQVEIEEKPVIKHEKTFKKPKSIKTGSKKGSVSKKKPPKSVFGILIPEYKDEKLDSVVMPVSTASNTITDVPMDCDSSKDVTVKEEMPNDFDADIDFDFPVDFKQETEMKMFTCSCEAIFKNEEEYKTHIETKNCRSYRKSMKIKLEKRNSLGGRIITIKKRIMCPECNVEFDTVKSCKIHQRTHRNDENGDYECTFCMRKFNRKSSYTTHLKHHEEKSKIKYICDTCKREFQHKAHLDNHIVAVHTSDKGFTCEICLMKFSTEKSLETHKDSHKTEKKHQCDICNKAFYMLSTLNDHMRTHTGERPFLCSICGRGFSQKTNLAQHMRRHQGLKPFKCEDCDRRFVSKGELVAHTRKHSGAHPFVCDACGGGFTTSSSLAKHRRTHTGERPYACDLCPMRFAASGTLKNHRRTHTGEKPFQCSYCEKAFVQRQDLISHIRCHTGERPFTCGCGQAFRKASALKAHAKTHTHPVVSQGQPQIV